LANITKSPNISAGDVKSAADVIAYEGSQVLQSSRVGIWRMSEQDINILESISCFDNISGMLDVQKDFSLACHPDYTKMLKAQRVIVTNNVNDAKYYNKDAI